MIKSDANVYKGIELEQMLEVTNIIAKEAGSILMEGFSQNNRQGIFNTSYKSSTIDIVTDYDLKSEQYIVQELTKHFPQHTIIGEEGGLYENNLDDAFHTKYIWHIDPLDGTVNFAHNFPMFCVSIGLVIDNVPSLGVIYNPATNELYSAALGLGATCNEKRLQVSDILSLEHALLITGFSYDTHTSNSNMTNFLMFQKTAQATRRIGSCALNLCYLAAGQLDGYWELKVKQHDMLAGIVIAREAGGKVTDFDGGDNFMLTGHIVASNGKIHQEMLKIINSANDR